jgi:hypothetical protein
MSTLINQPKIEKVEVKVKRVTGEIEIHKPSGTFVDGIKIKPEEK